jgi:hypothetical protein
MLWSENRIGEAGAPERLKTADAAKSASKAGAHGAQRRRLSNG